MYDDMNECLTIKPGRMHAIVGSTDTGKTNLVKLIVKHNAKSWHRIYAMCGTLNVQDDYDWVKPEYKCFKPNEDFIKNIITYQENNLEIHSLLILDDVIGHLKFRTDIFNIIASSGRKYRLTVILCLQDFKNPSPIMRDNLATLYTTGLKEHSLKATYDLTKGFSSLKEFKDFIDSNTGDYQVVKFNLTGFSQNPIQIFLPPVCNRFRIVYKMS